MADSPINAMALGMDIEEIYHVFGEGIQVMGHGLDPRIYDLAERKAMRVRDLLLDFACPPSVIRRFEDLAARVHRSGDPFPAGMDVPGFADLNIRTAEALSSLMGEIRGYLTSINAALYDSGVMLARLHLCLRAVRAASPLNLDELYTTELRRLTPILLQMLNDLFGYPGLRRQIDRHLTERLHRLAAQLEAPEAGSGAWVEDTLRRADSVFAALGTVDLPWSEPSHSTMEEPPGTVGVPATGGRASPDTEKDDEQLAEVLLGDRRRLLQLFHEEQFGLAERGQRLLIDDCRSVLGANHPFTLAVRGDLCVTLLAQEQDDLALALAHDLVTDAETWLGAQEAATARALVLTLFILMATREFEECYRFYNAKLRWLADADPRSLDEELLLAQEELLEMIGGQEGEPD